MALHSNGTTGTIASSPSLPLELVEEEILSRLPVKKLLQLRCICKSWKSLISNDPKFAKKHLHMSKILKHQHHHLIVNDLGDRIFWESPLSSVFSNVYNHTVTLTQLNIPISISNPILKISSCDGILCLTLGVVGGGRRYVVLCNPSLRKYTTLPPLENHQKREVLSCLFSFGYDHVNDVYKVIAISCFKDKHKVKVVDVYTLGTNNWRSIQDFPYSSPSPSMYHSGVFVGGTVNWLAYEVSNSSHRRVIVSLDLMTESYQKLSQPDLEKDHWILGMCQNCLCIFQCRDMFLDVWIMKEYGNKESWTKLYNIPSAEGQYTYPRTVYISDNNQVLFCYHDLRNSKLKLVVYNSKNGNVMIPKIQHNGRLFMNPRVYVESLISLPCSY